jgi:Putative zinc-finger
MDGPADIRCRDIVELVTAYVEDGMDDADRTRFEMHIVVCRGCERYLEQMRTARDVTAEAEAEEPDPEQLEELLETFRGWRRRTLEER